MKKNETILTLRKRAVETITLEIPVEAVASLRKVATSRDMSEKALLKLYIGNGLRQDLAKLFSDKVLEMTHHVLSRHLQSEDKVEEIMKEICDEKEAA